MPLPLEGSKGLGVVWESAAQTAATVAETSPNQRVVDDPSFTGLEPSMHPPSCQGFLTTLMLPPGSSTGLWFFYTRHLEINRETITKVSI